MEPSRVLVVDDDAPFRARLTAAFSDRGHQVCAAASLSEALEVTEGFFPTHAVVDLRLGTGSGLTLLPTLFSRFQTKIVVLTGYGSVATALESIRCGAVNYLAKPISMEALIEALFGEPLRLVVEDTPKSDSALERVEWEHIQRVLRECDGNITHAARRLGIHRQALQRKLRQPPVVR